jgi:glutamate/tyrosine decarboxylase-like PLP-dependent enzyme
MSDFPYADTFEINRSLPENGTDKDTILAMMTSMSRSENAVWESGQCSGTMYCGDHDHYDFLNEAFAHFSYVNSLQRDMCPSATKFEAEIIAMTLDLLHASALQESSPVGLVTSGGSGSIAHAVLAYREFNAANVARPNIIKPETAHPAFDKACHLFGVELRIAPVDPVTTQVDLEWVRRHIDANTVALVGSACNYGYGTVDPISDLGRIALEHEVGLHVDGCLGGFILPFGRELGYDIEPFDFEVPGVTSISADTHKYGYALKGTSVLSFADQALRNSQYFYQPDWSGGKYCSPGMDGSRSGGLLAATWAAMVHLGRSGYRRYAEAIFSTSKQMQEAVKSHESLRIMGAPSFLFSFTSDEFDIYHVNDFLRTRGWRMNGQQYPNAIHMAVTRPTDPAGHPRTLEHGPRRCSRLRQSPRQREAEVRRHLRRSGRRPHRGSG